MMKVEYQIKNIFAIILVTSLLFGSFSALIVEASEISYTLEDSEVLSDNGNWVSTSVTYNTYNQNYNCYAYALGRVESKFYNINAGIQYQPGNIFTNTQYYGTYQSDNMDLFRCCTIKDLIAMGYTNIEVSYNIMPTINENQELICLRMGYYYCLEEDENGKDKEIIGTPDYHFMRYDYYTQAWYHKPGTSAILKYVSEDGILADGSLATNVPWSGEGVYANGMASDTEYGTKIKYIGDIVYITYDKHQIIVSDNGTSNDEIIVQGGNDFYCCTDGVCCCGRESCNHFTENGTCCCGYNCGDTSGSFSSGKDVIYEIVVPESCGYTIQLSTEYEGHDFNYEIYSYNMYNGNYMILEQGSGNSTTGAVETVILRAYNDFNDNSENWQYQAYRYYIRLDFARANTSDETINVSITRNCSYTDHYEAISSVFHKAYCACGAFEFEEHVMVDGECELCGEVHVHEYTEYEYYSNTQHVAKCPCGEIGTDFSAHTVGGGIGRFKKCIFCGGLVDTFSGPNQLESTINMVTANGSYILPNGVIVLVDEDIEAYLNGTLVFYNRGDSSEAA